MTDLTSSVWWQQGKTLELYTLYNQGCIYNISGHLYFKTIMQMPAASFSPSVMIVVSIHFGKIIKGFHSFLVDAASAGGLLLFF